jgi:hypothetical protein
MPQNKELTLSEKAQAKHYMESRCYRWEIENHKQIEDIKLAECLLQDALEDFNKEVLKDPNVSCWWQLTNHEDIFAYLFGINTDRHTLQETIDHFSSILSHPA